jgi:TetR/AcrR family transcriptional repressor of nem operon
VEQSLTTVKTIGHIGFMPQRSVKTQLVKKAEEVFRQRGYNGASVQEITAAAGVPKGSFYNHYGSKEAMAADIVRRYSRATDLSGLGSAGEAPLERLRRHFAAQVDRTTSSGVEFGCLLGTFASEIPSSGEQVRDAVQEGLTAWTDAVAKTIKAAQEAGEVKTNWPAQELAALLIDAFEGGALRAKIDGDPEVTRVHLDVVFGLITT